MDCYCHAYKAILTLDADHEQWQQTLLPLQDQDVVSLHGGLYNPEEKKSEGNKSGSQVAESTNISEGFRMVWWIWISPGAVNSGTVNTKVKEGMHDGRHLSRYIYLDLTHHVQLSISNGLVPVHGPCDGGRKSCCYVRR